MVAAVNGIRYGGYPPNIAAALSLARWEIFTPVNGARGRGVLQLAVLFVTETVSRYRSETLRQAWLAASSEADVGIVTVSVSSFVDRQLLASITSYPSDRNLFILTSVRNLGDLVQPIKRTVCSGATQKLYTLL